MPAAKKPRARGPDQRELARAARRYSLFAGRGGTEVVQLELKPLPREGLVFGSLVMVGYQSVRDAKMYVHKFRKKSRPLLIASPDGSQVLIVGGRFAFTDRGIVDR